MFELSDILKTPPPVKALLLLKVLSMINSCEVIPSATPPFMCAELFTKQLLFKNEMKLSVLYTTPPLPPGGSTVFIVNVLLRMTNLE